MFFGGLISFHHYSLQNVVPWNPVTVALQSRVCPTNSYKDAFMGNRIRFFESCSDYKVAHQSEKSPLKYILFTGPLSFHLQFYCPPACVFQDDMESLCVVHSHLLEKQALMTNYPTGRWAIFSKCLFCPFSLSNKGQILFFFKKKNGIITQSSFCIFLKMRCSPRYVGQVNLSELNPAIMFEVTTV